MEFDEKHIDAVTAVSGSGPAYVFYLAEMMTDAAIELGIDRGEAAKLACHTISGASKMLVEAGIDAIELSGGMISSGKLSPSRSQITSEEKEAYFRTAAAAYKKEINVPLILVGGNRSLNVAEQIVTEGIAEYISMCRPFIREPDLVRRWETGDKSPAKCKSDNMCFGPALAGKGIYCVVEEQERSK